MKFFLLLRRAVLIAALFFSFRPAAAVERLELQRPPLQLLLVVSKNWEAKSGVLQRYDRAGADWAAVGPAIQIVLGRNGLGWGRGLLPQLENGPQKKEGDGKSPAGVFAIRHAFGYANPEKLQGIKMPYVQCTKNLECVDDTNSAEYNQVLDRTRVKNPAWNSSEHMLMTNGQYRLGLVVEHNMDPPLPGDGSCIFLHIWAGPNIGTAGCTAMREGDLEGLVAWIDPQANPILVQLPEKEYRRLKTSWQLPPEPKLAQIAP